MLISKVLQNLSNDVSFGAKEPFMQPMNEFISGYRSKMMALQERLAEVPLHKLQEITNRELPTFDESSLESVHELVYKHRQKILESIEELEQQGKVTVCPPPPPPFPHSPCLPGILTVSQTPLPLSDCFFAVAMQMGLPVSERKKIMAAEAEAAAAAAAAATS